MADLPSWRTSTLSQMAMGAFVSYEVGCLVLILGGGWFKNVAAVKMGFDGLRWSAEAFAIGYLARQQGKQNGADPDAPAPK